MASIAVVLGSEYEDSEFDVPKQRLSEKGHQLTLIGSEAGQTVEGKRGNSRAEIEASAKDTDPGKFDALLIPGGHSPDKLRMDENVVRFVRHFVDTDKPIAAVCHGPQLLIEARAVKGKTMTSWPSVRTDLLNAGATWLDEPVVKDGKLVTSRKPDDLEQFSAAFDEML